MAKKTYADLAGTTAQEEAFHHMVVCLPASWLNNREQETSKKALRLRNRLAAVIERAFELGRASALPRDQKEHDGGTNRRNG